VKLYVSQNIYSNLSRRFSDGSISTANQILKNEIKAKYGADQINST